MPKIDYKITEARVAENRETITKIWNESLPDSELAEEKLKWYYLNNPAGTGKCWLLKRADDAEAVGVTGLGFRDFVISGRKVKAGVASDFAVNREHRSLMPALMLQKTTRDTLNGEIEFIYGLPNKNAVGVLLRAGYKRLGYFVRYAKPLDIGEYLGRKVSGIFNSGLLKPSINIVARAFSREGLRTKNDKYTIRNVAEFDSRFDELCDSVLRRFEACGARGSAFLNWRFRDCPLINYRTHALFTGDEKRLLGYAVYYIEGKAAKVADLVFDDSDEVYETLISSLIHLLRSEGLVSLSISFLENEGIAGRLADYGFSPRGDKRPLVLFAKDRDSLPEASRWRLFLADEDYN